MIIHQEMGCHKQRPQKFVHFRIDFLQFFAGGKIGDQPSLLVNFTKSFTEMSFGLFTLFQYIGYLSLLAAIIELGLGLAQPLMRHNVLSCLRSRQVL